MGKTYKDAKSDRGPQWERLNKRGWDRVEEEYTPLKDDNRSPKSVRKTRDSKDKPRAYAAYRSK